MKKFIVIMGLLLSCVFATVSCQAKSNIQEAEACIKIERFDDASIYLQKAIMEDKLNAGTHYKAGVIYSEMGINWYGYADQCLRVAAKLGYDKKVIADQYKHNADILFCNRRYASAEEYYNQAISYNPWLKNDIIQGYEEKIRYSLIAKDAKQAEVFVQRLLRIDPSLNIRLYNMVMDYGERFGVIEGIDIFLLGQSLCKDCDRNETVGLQLKEVADIVEQQIFNDPLTPQQRVELFEDVERYKELARKFIKLPKFEQALDIDTHWFKLKTEEITDRWITLPYGIITTYQFGSDNFQYEILLKDGRVIRRWQGKEECPVGEDLSAGFKLRGVKETTVRLKVEIAQ